MGTEEEYVRRVFESHVGKTAGGTTASADLDWRKAWELAFPVVVAARRFTLSEADGNEALIEDSHFQLLRALTDYFAGGPHMPTHTASTTTTAKRSSLDGGSHVGDAAAEEKPQRKDHA